jgi:hypothetical protein
MSAGARAIATARVVSSSHVTGPAASASVKDVEGQDEGQKVGGGGRKGGKARHMRIGRVEGGYDRGTDFPAPRIAKVDLPVEVSIVDSASAYATFTFSQR